METAAARFPATIIQRSDVSGCVIAFRLGKTVADIPMRTLMVAVVLKTGEFSLQNPRSPKRHMIKALRQFPCDT